MYLSNSGLGAIDLPAILARAAVPQSKYFGLIALR